MTLDDALRELGIGTETGAEQARRAYLRLLKTRKPEVDPTGFRRLREAYELVHAAIGWRPNGGLPVDPIVQRPQPTPAALDDSGAPELAPAPDPMEPFRARLEALPLGAPHEARIAIARDATSAEPASVEAWGMLVDGLSDASREEECVAALRSAAALGLQQFLHELLEMHPDRLTTAEIAELRQTDDPHVLAIVARVLAQRGDPAGASELAIGLMARSDDALPLASTDVIRWILDLCGRGQLDRASTLLDRFERWLRARGDETRRIGTESAALWSIAREICALPSDFPLELRVAIAKAALGGDLLDAGPVLESFRQTDPAGARRAAELLLEHTTVLDRALRNFVQNRAGAPRRIARGRPSPYLAWVIPAVAIGVLRLFSQPCDSGPAIDRARSVRGVYVEDGALEVARRAGWAFCREPGGLSISPLCAHCLSTVRFLESHDCARARSAWNDARRALDDLVARQRTDAGLAASWSLLLQHRDEVDAALAQRCGAAP